VLAFITQAPSPIYTGIRISPGTHLYFTIYKGSGTKLLSKYQKGTLGNQHFLINISHLRSTIMCNISEISIFEQNEEMKKDAMY
jgi:hypothetical protein